MTWFIVLQSLNNLPFKPCCLDVSRKSWSLTQQYYQLWLWSLHCYHKTNHSSTERANLLGTCKRQWQHVTQLSMCCTGVNPDSFQELILHTYTSIEQITHSSHQNGENAFMWSPWFWLIAVPSSVRLRGREVVLVVVQSVCCNVDFYIASLDR